MSKNSNTRKRLIYALITVITLISVPQASAQAFEYPEVPDAERIAVRYQGSRPTIADFATAFLKQKKDIAFFNQVLNEWQRYLQKKPLSKNVSIILDTKNGYMHCEIVKPEEKAMVMEMCFWNCADGKRKLVCANVYMPMDGDYGWNDDVGSYFYVYTNKTRVMRTVWPDDIGALYDGDGLSVFFLPREGKNIKVSAAGGGERWEEELIWDGYQFSSDTTP